jgi:predicted transcriptional regulator YheO
MSKRQEFEQIKPMLATIARGLSQHFGSDCEVAIHDITGGIDNTIAIIENGHVSGRKIGDAASETVLEALRNKNIEDRYGYILNSKSGRTLKSSTINIRNDDGEVIAVVCLNYDISNFVLAERSINDFTSVDLVGGETETIVDQVADLLDQLIAESHRMVGKPVSSMTKEDKIAALKYLDAKGAFLIKKSSERIAEYYCISKYTLYNYLGADVDS